jgi:protein-L-isoaspartate(D-aspartate) O-methyltransferase
LPAIWVGYSHIMLSDMTIEECRRFYSEEIRFTGDIHSPAVIEAFARVPREKFLGPGPWEVVSAETRALSVAGGMQMSYTQVDDPRDLYHNVVVVIDKSADINNGQPSALARWIEALDLKPGDRAYHLGGGVGYYTAILAEIVGPDGSVACSEVHPDLAVRAQKNLSGYPNVTVFAGDGATFDPGECDAMLINAGVTHPSPLWLDRLRDGGRLVVPLTMATTPTIGFGVMAKIVRESGRFLAEMVTPLAIYSCKSMRDAQREPRIQAAMTGGKLMKLKSVRRDAHEPSDTCLVHGDDVCVSSAAVS